MEQRTTKNSTVPTPYGWVLVSQNKFDLDEVVSFQSQLASFSRAIGASHGIAPEMGSSRVEELALVKAS